jgi:hypothetical protein
MTDEELKIEGARCAQELISSQLSFGKVLDRIPRDDNFTDRVATFVAAYINAMSDSMDEQNLRVFCGSVFAGIASVTGIDVSNEFMRRVEAKLKRRSTSKGVLQ